MPRGIAALAQSALRHGGFDEVAIDVAGTELRISPVTPASAPVVLGEDLRDLGAAVARDSWRASAAHSPSRARRSSCAWPRPGS